MEGSRHPIPSPWLQDALSFSPDVPSQLLFLAPPDPFLKTLLFLPGNLTHLLNFISHFPTLNSLIQGSANVFYKGPDSNSLKVCRGFLGGPVVKKPSCNAGGYWFDPWSGKIPYAVEHLSLCPTTTELTCCNCQSPVYHRAHALQQREATAVRSLCTATRAGPALCNYRKPTCSNTDPVQPKINK